MDFPIPEETLKSQEGGLPALHSDPPPFQDPFGVEEQEEVMSVRLGRWPGAPSSHVLRCSVQSL